MATSRRASRRATRWRSWDVIRPVGSRPRRCLLPLEGYADGVRQVIKTNRILCLEHCGIMKRGELAVRQLCPDIVEKLQRLLRQASVRRLSVEQSKPVGQLRDDRLDARSP